MHTTTDRTHNLLQYSDRLGTYISKLFDEIIKKRNSFVRKKKMKYQQRYIIHRIYAVFICIFVLLIFLIMKSRNFSTIPNHPEGLKIYSVHQARYLLRNESMSLNIYEHTVQSVYIDIGCFNGETIEHFIHFTRNSILYDIITFEPDPVNYHLCKEKLSRAKYKDYNIFIIPEVAWIYNGKVSYRIDRGEKSGLYRKKSNKEPTYEYNVVELDAIDFSSWLSNFIRSNETKVHIKVSMPGFETQLLEKMLLDNTISIADKWDVEWAYRESPHIHTQRVYLQSMFDSLGFTCIGFTVLENVRKVFKAKLSYGNVTIFSNLKVLPDFDTFTHYIQRPSVTNSPRMWTTRVIPKKL